MPNPPLGKQKEIPVNPESLDVKKKAMEGLEAIEAELEKAEKEEKAKKAEKDEEGAEKASVSDAPATTPVAARVSARVAIDPLAEKIEDILEQDMTDLYLAMLPDQKVLFKQKGEETVSKIRRLLTSAKVNAKKIFELLRDWLKIIPGINRFFLEQEAKIKTDKILFMNEQEKKL